MDRRKFLKIGAAASAAVSLPYSAESEPANARGQRPNVLYVFSDQHRAASLPGEPLNQALAPTLDRFRRENLSMDQCISNFPLCTPHRAILISGLYPTESGIVSNLQTLETTTPGLGEAFKRAGYHTGYVGKWHLYQGEGKFVPKGPLRFGFEDWHVWANTNKHYDGITFNPETGERITIPGYQPTGMTDQALEFLKEQKPDKPWMLVVSWNPPHPPYNPPAEDAAPYPPAGLELRPNVRLSTPADQIIKPWPEFQNMETLRKAEQGYYGAITAVDKEFARLLSALDEHGMAENTIVIYTSDHGDNMGSHGHMEKQMPHEESVRVPFMVRLPGEAKARSSDTLFASVDIYPTLCGLAGIPVPRHCSGRDHSSLMRGNAKFDGPEMVFLMNVKGPSDHFEANVPSYRGVRTRTHTYAMQLDGRWCLYDNIADPYQLKNLIREPASQPLIERLEAALRAWGKRTGDTFPYDKANALYSEYPGT